MQNIRQGCRRDNSLGVLAIFYFKKREVDKNGNSTGNVRKQCI